MDETEKRKGGRGLWSSPARKALLCVLAVTAFLILVSSIFVGWDYGQVQAADRLEHIKLYVSIFKAIIIGLGVALAGVLIPAIFAESSEAFARLKESRAFYSKAKTGVDYLPLRLSALPLSEAAALLQEVHFNKHQAELFDELKIHLAKRYDAPSDLTNPEHWGDWMYNRLFEMRTVLEKNAKRWDKMSPESRLALFMTVRKSVNDLSKFRAGEMQAIDDKLERLRRRSVRPTLE